MSESMRKAYEMREVLTEAEKQGFAVRVGLWDGREVKGKVKHDPSEPFFRVGRKKVNFMNVVEVEKVQA